MTTMHADLTVTALPVPVPSERVAFERGQSIQAVVTVRAALSRDDLAAAADLSAQYDNYTDPDQWSVPYTRRLVELSVAHTALADISMGADGLQRIVDDPGRAERPVVQALYRAIDRAYPPQPPAVTVSGGWSATCNRCPWTAPAVDDERAVAESLAHFVREHDGGGS